jgi:putative membrane protein
MSWPESETKGDAAAEPSPLGWSGRYWLIALTCWVAASVGGVVWALVSGAAWKYPVAWAVAWLIFVVALWWAIATMREDEKKPEAILRERYARGEIDEAEYRRRLTILRRL